LFEDNAGAADLFPSANGRVRRTERAAWLRSRPSWPGWAAGKPVEFVVMPGKDCGLSIAATRQVMLENAIAFVEKQDAANQAPAAALT
jgi:hypothetical protein